mmetsp:Transcript_99813/g.122095  ORF Transcript_99813/g.122095 Transcript_99813/m.122095 type:complete len:91 (+) Transcript_99813:1226-1498(+)
MSKTSKKDTTKSLAKNPSEFIKNVMGRPVIVKLNNGVSYHGILSGLDEYMNITMEQTEEFENQKFLKRYGDVFIRGNNIFFISMVSSNYN